MMIDESAVNALEKANEELKARIVEMGKGYELLKKEKADLENEVENLKLQIREMEKYWREESGKVEAYEFALSVLLSVIFGHANP